MCTMQNNGVVTGFTLKVLQPVIHRYTGTVRNSAAFCLLHNYLICSCCPHPQLFIISDFYMRIFS